MWLTVTAFVQAVRWGIDVIITDVTKTWLDLRGALQGSVYSLGSVFPHAADGLHVVDYDKIAAQYSRMFYWTTLEFYTPMQIYQRRKDHSYLEGYAGPFRKMDIVEPLPLVASS